MLAGDQHGSRNRSDDDQSVRPTDCQAQAPPDLRDALELTAVVGAEEVLVTFRDRQHGTVPAAPVPPQPSE